MAHLRRTPFAILLAAFIVSAHPMHIPEDMEILDGYEMDSAGTEINPEDDFYEQRSLLEPFMYRAIRDRREIPYRVLESPGLRSHFRQRPDTDDGFQQKEHHSRRRNRRSIDMESVDAVTEESPKPTEELPKPEKQMMNERTVEAWAKTPYQVKAPAKQEKEESGDSEAEASMISEGIKARAPRVNFVTQRKSNPDSLEAREDKIIPELYRKPLARLYYEYPDVPRIYDSYSAQSQSPMYPKVYNKYDGFHRDMMDRMHPPAPHRFDNYYQRRHDTDYDSYFPRQSFSSYYYYPDKRFDVPSYYRDRHYLFTNDVIDPVPAPAPSPTSIYVPSRNRRIIYYANLPEIVRTPPNVDLRYHNYNKYNNRFSPFHTTKAPMSSYKLSTSKHDDRKPGDRKEDKYVSSTPIKIVREIAGQQESPNVNNSAGRRSYAANGAGGAGRSGTNYQDAARHEQDRSYFGRHH
ncbi:uncharacterized protein LOC129779597 [Toxorhynchites rutilus septentrionalis]|uniref:uncharacterized protein LOC129779597 n=1 Tax=Toxorhynchites rutilus septentrionalis TaxID=329112 RepID=UPI002479CCD8|nr:uncharacterized protein LOC129779597 [Toxorhynchites rutilus septentrionalis]